MTIVNRDAVADRLVGIKTPAAAAAHIGGGTPLAGIDLPPGRAMRLDHAGLYIELTGLAAPLENGASVPLQL